MKLDKVLAHLTSAQTELDAASMAERKVLADPAVSAADAAKAGPSLFLAGVVGNALKGLHDSITKSAEAGKIVGSLKSLSKVRKPKAKKAKATDETTAAAGKKK